eukprot:m.35655 g.35655  ORF g.35655 m.35655 type:complete len:433 (+) comp12414_c0_seq1:268-1566(+)
MSDSSIKNVCRTSVDQTPLTSSQPMNMQMDLMSSASHSLTNRSLTLDSAVTKKTPSDGLALESLLTDDLFLFELSDEETTNVIELAHSLESGDEQASSGTSSPALTPYDGKPDPFDFHQITRPQALSTRSPTRSHTVPASAESPSKAVKPLQRGGSLDTLFEARQRSAEAWPANPTAKPPYSFPCLIGMAMLHHNNTPVAVADLYNYILERYPYFKTAKSGWKNSIRHNLSLNKYFLKVERDVPDVRKGSLWAMVPGKEDNMRRDIENCRVRHERKLAGLSPRVRKRRSTASRRSSALSRSSTSQQQSPSPVPKSASYSPMPLQAHHHQYTSANTPTAHYQAQRSPPPMMPSTSQPLDYGYNASPGPLSRRATEPTLSLAPHDDDFLFVQKGLEPWANEDLFSALDADNGPNLHDYMSSLDTDILDGIPPPL